MPRKSPTSVKLGAVCGIVSSTGQKPSVVEQVGWQWQMDVLHQEHKTCVNSWSWTLPETSPARANQAHVESARSKRWFAKAGLSQRVGSSRNCKKDTGTDLLFMLEKGMLMRCVKNVLSKKELLIQRGLIWECAQISIPTLSRRRGSRIWMQRKMRHCLHFYVTVESELMQSLVFNNVLRQNQYV